MREPLLLPLAAFAAGIMAGHAASFELFPLLLAALGLVLVYVVARWKCPRIALAPLLAISALAGIQTVNWRRQGPAPELDAESSETLLVTGCVVEPPEKATDKLRFVVELEPGARVRVSLTPKNGEALPSLRYGQTVEVEAKVRKPRNYKNPGSFDYTGYLARRHIYWTGSARGVTKLQVLPGSCGSSTLAAVYAVREAILRRIEHLYAGDAYTTGIMQALLVGEDSQVEKLWTEEYRRTGTYHALVVSGLHVSVLAGLLLAILRLCFVPEFWRAVLCIGAAWTYALLAGWQAPVIRAAGGFTLFLLGGAFYRKPRVLNVLAAVGLAFLIFDPEQLFEPSFQLSFLAVAAIGGLAAPVLERTADRLAEAFRSIHQTRDDLRMSPGIAQLRVELRLIAETMGLWMGVPAMWCARTLAFFGGTATWIFSGFFVSFCVGIAMALPMILYFHRLSLTSVSANLIVVPALNASIVTGFASVATGWHWLASLARAPLFISRAVVGWHARFESSSRVPDPPLWLGIFFCLALVVTAWTLRGRARWAIASAVASVTVLLVIALYSFPNGSTPGNLELIAIDVGQGDSLLLTLPDGRTMLVDGGGFPSFGKTNLNIGEDVVSPYLWRRGFRQVDIVAATHSHDDHIGGLAALIRNFHPREVWTGASPKTAAWGEVESAAKENGAKVLSWRAGAQIRFGPAAIDVLAPSRDYVAAATPKNDDSLVLLVRFGRHSFLLTGDAERATEYQLLASGTLPHIDVLKVGHHGSKSSTNEDFLGALRPAFGLISVGADNWYGHPHPDVLERLKESHVEVLRTDLSGLTAIRSDGRRLQVGTTANIEQSAPYPVFGGLP